MQSSYLDSPVSWFPPDHDPIHSLYLQKAGCQSRACAPRAAAGIEAKLAYARRTLRSSRRTILAPAPLAPLSVFPIRDRDAEDLTADVVLVGAGCGWKSRSPTGVRSSRPTGRARHHRRGSDLTLQQ